MASRTGKLHTSDFMKMDKDDPRRQRWEETSKKAHAQDMHELDQARYGTGSRQKALQDPDSLEARVRDNSPAYAKTAEGKSYLHNKDQQAKSQAGADARTAARDYASQRREDTKAAYLEGQAAGRTQGRSAQAAESRGRGRGGYGGPPSGYGGRGGDPRQMRGGRGGFSSNPFRSGGMGRSGGRGRVGGRGISSGGRTINSVPEAVFPGSSDPKKPYTTGGNQSKGMVDQAAAGNAVAAAEKYQNTGIKFNKEAQQWQHRDTGKAVSGKERADQVRHYGAYTEKGREGIGYSGKAPSNFEKGSDAYYGQEFSQSHARGSAWTEHQQKNDPTLDTKGLKSKWIEQRRAFDNYDPMANATAAPATGKGPSIGSSGSQSKGKDFLDSVKTQVPTREEELSQKYDNEIFNKEKGIVGQYFHDYAGTKPMEKGGDEAAYMKGMKDNWVERQLLGDKWDKEMMTWEGDKAQHPSGAKAQSTEGALHMLGYINKHGAKPKDQSNEDYYKGMKDAWIDKQQLGNQWDRDMITWEGDKAQHPSGMKAQSTKGAEYALGYINKHGKIKEGQSNQDYYQGMKDQWISEQTGYAAGVKNKIAEVQGKSKGKDFLDSKIGKTPEKPKGTDVKDQIKVTGGNLVSAVVKPTPVSPPKAAPPQGGMNTGATTDLSNVQRAPNQYEKGSDPYAKAREEAALKKEKERARAEAAKPPSEPAKRPETQLWDGVGDYAPGYGGRIGAPPGTMFTMDHIDRDGDGLDDRSQPGPGLKMNWEQEGSREAASQRWAQNNPDYFERTGKTPPPMSTQPKITPPPQAAPPSYQEPARDYIRYKNKKPGGVSSDADRYALLTGKSSMGGGTTTPKGGSSTPDYSYDYGLGKSTSDDADRYALLTGNYSGKSYLDKYLNR